MRRTACLVLTQSWLKAMLLFYQYQPGFRSRSLTDTCLIYLLTDFIKFQMDKGHFVGMILLDLQRAFDTIAHTILLMKLEALSLSQDITKWFQSYLSDRQQLVDVSGTLSSYSKITYGVPHGSIFRPLLFLIYVNDMAGALDERLLLCADDSAILVSDKDVTNIESLLQNELAVVSEWLIDNKLSLHLGKTVHSVGSRPRLRSKSVLNISYKGSTIEGKKHLCATLEQSLSGETMVNFIIQKANARLKFLYRKQRFLLLKYYICISNVYLISYCIVLCF